MDSLLWNEYAMLYGVYEGYNEQFLTLKSWSVSIGIAALMAAYSDPVSSYGRIAVVIAALSAIPFWFTETLWKLFQRITLEQIKEIEACVRDNASSCMPAQIATHWKATFDDHAFRFWAEGLVDPHVMFPHLFLLLTGGYLAIFRPPASKL